MSADNNKDSNLSVVCLQKHPKYIEDCVTLLNSEWPRSRTARLRSIEQGKPDGLPTSLVLLQKNAFGCKSVIGHSKIQSMPHKSDCCFVESVVIDKAHRGKGYGKILMEETENYVKLLGIKCVYLTTLDKQAFYSKLGYEFSEPVIVFGGGGNFKFLNERNSQSLLEPTINSIKNLVIDNSPTEAHNNCDAADKYPSPGGLSPPPPPPLPSNLNISQPLSFGSKIYMKKILS